MSKLDSRISVIEKKLLQKKATNGLLIKKAIRWIDTNYFAWIDQEGNLLATENSEDGEKAQKTLFFHSTPTT